jgi:TetR/AcrR family transcriptional regulator
MNAVVGATRRRLRRPRGRPPTASEADVRGALLDAAQRLFLKHGFERVTARQIAAQAGTTPAMIHYYFTNKLGLFRAMLQRAIEPFQQLLGGALAARRSEGLDLRAVITAHMHTAAANPWIATLVINEVFAEKGRFRATFIRDVASKLAPMLLELLERGRAAGRFRAEMEPRYAALSLLSLCVFPFVSRAVTGPVLGVKLEGAELERLIAHTADIYLSGIEKKKTELAT